MTCQELTDYLLAYLDGDLPDPERAEFETHLGECPDCVAYLSTYRQAIALAKSACTPEGDIAPEVPDELVRAVLAARHNPKRM